MISLSEDTSTYSNRNVSSYKEMIKNPYLKDIKFDCSTSTDYTSIIKVKTDNIGKLYFDEDEAISFESQTKAHSYESVFKFEYNATTAASDELRTAAAFKYGIKDIYRDYLHHPIFADHYHTTADTGNCFVSLAKTPAQRLQDVMKKRQAPGIIIRNALRPASNNQEIRARETLRRVVGDEKFKDFLKKGFVSVQGRSGKVYQIFPGHGMTNVYLNGERIEKLCVVMKGNFPPTDSLIMRYLLILNCEEDFRNKSIVHNFSAPSKHELKQDKRSLVEIFQDFKAAA